MYSVIFLQCVFELNAVIYIFARIRTQSHKKLHQRRAINKTFSGIQTNAEIACPPISTITHFVMYKIFTYSCFGDILWIVNSASRQGIMRYFSLNYNHLPLFPFRQFQKLHFSCNTIFLRRRFGKFMLKRPLEKILNVSENKAGSLHRVGDVCFLW